MATHIILKTIALNTSKLVEETHIFNNTHIPTNTYNTLTYLFKIREFLPLFGISLYREFPFTRGFPSQEIRFVRDFHFI